MFYKLLGMAVWKTATLYLRSRYGGRPSARLVAALGGLLAAGAGAAVLAARNSGDSE